jgi:hypothetical protein
MIKKVKTILLFMFLVVAVFSIYIAVKLVLINNKQNNIQNNKSQY